MKHYTYTPEGICPVQIDYDIEDGKIYNVKYLGGCNGNLKAIGVLLDGMKIEEVGEKMREEFGDTYWWYNIFGRKMFIVHRKIDNELPS